ncbi:MAG: hydantoinase B/oxoprolinase family protein, partial [Myxococcota bacterium]|nr:hydantoinase B/oxoprolinase family protein [Myxococcota bacterium]
DGSGEWRGRDAALSGPAGGVIAVADLAARLGLGPTIGLDMGGTSTDVCRVDGAPARVPNLEIAGLRLRVPAVRLETVAAGGGSRLGQVAGAYAVGPRSAGAQPGPAAYGRGGPATLTDCEVVLGRLPDFPPVCGPNRDAALDTAAARAAVASLDPSSPVESIAEGYRAVGQEAMAAAVRGLCARLGTDPAVHALVAFGGAGPAHACGVARRLGIRRVVVPGLASVFSAVGIGRGQRRAEVVVPIEEGIEKALADAHALLPFAGHVTARVAMRHVGTQATLEVSAANAPEWRTAFDRAHAEQFGASRPELAVEAVEVRVAVESVDARPVPRVELSSEDIGTTEAFFGTWQAVPCGPMGSALGLPGPALLTGPGTTVVVDVGWRATWSGNALILEDEAPVLSGIGTAPDPVHAAIIASRLGSVAREMGARLGRLARSVSIRERQDYSCALFDADGNLVVNAPHVPVHLGAMGETVRALLKAHESDLRPGEAWVCNDPYQGGSHLPDITVMQPVFDASGARLAFVACRGHHVDVGGSTPGSMPSTARHIDEEGLCLSLQRISGPTGVVLPDLSQSRQPEDVAADLRAQVAACRAGADGVTALVEALGASVIRAWLGHLQDMAESAVEAELRARQGVHSALERLDDGTEIRVRLSVEGDRARLDIDAPTHPGNRNAPTAVARAALLYVFRCLVEDQLPLNEGALRPFDVRPSPGGLFDPVWPAAVAGGNVESSQRLVDALFVALGALAGSQGTMNNLSVGTPRGAFYETIGGGMGAGPDGPGATAVQCHMTNTDATDVEELEARFPVVIDAWRRRPGSGGRGRHRGGDGVVKVWRFLA